MKKSLLCCMSIALAHGAVMPVLVKDIEELGLDTGAVLALQQDGLPVALAHGMGDACANPGFKQITQLVGEHLGVYSTCIPDGDGQPLDTVNAFLTTMWKQVDTFNKGVQADEKLKDGFNAIGLSQGNLVIRGYIQKYNNPPVKKFLSICGPMAGTGSLPRCDPDGLAAALCEKVTDIVGDVAYSSFIQGLVAQSNYLKVPTELDAYRKYSPFLPLLNNEVDHADKDMYKKNFESLETLILVMAESDSMIFPKDSEWFGYFKDGQWKEIVDANMTDAYTKNTFGLKTLLDSDRVAFRSFKGDHLQFSLSELYSWLDEFF